MAGLLYLPRIFVYHAETFNNEEKKETFKLMEKRLFFYIMNPAMILSWLFGILLIHSIGMVNFSYLWLQIKLILVIFLTIYHFFLLQCLKSFNERNSKFSPKFYRIINEIPTLFLIAIIFVVVFKPL
jgi:putative membrane protein